MPLTPIGMDPETPGSRFTLHPAIALSHPDHSEPSEALAEVFGAEALMPQDGLGDAEVIPGGIGRGGEGPGVVVQWVLLLAAASVIQGAAWAGTKAAADALKRVIRKRQKGPRIFISRGAAALLAIGVVKDEEPGTNAVVIEAVEEPSAISGHTSPELNYVGIEPWVVFLLVPDSGLRFIVAVDSGGSILGHLRIPLGENELGYLSRQFTDDPDET